MIFNKKYLIASALFLQSLSYATQDLSIDNTTATAQMEGIEQLVNLTATYEKKTNPTNNTTFCSFQLTEDSATKVASFIESKYKTDQDEFTENQKREFMQAITNKHVVGTNNPFHISINSESASNIKDEDIKSLTEKLTFSVEGIRLYTTFIAASVQINSTGLTDEEKEILKHITNGQNLHISLVKIDPDNRKTERERKDVFMKREGAEVAEKIQSICEAYNESCEKANSVPSDFENNKGNIMQAVKSIRQIFHKDENAINKQIDTYLTNNTEMQKIVTTKKEYLNNTHELTIDTLDLCILENFFFSVNVDKNKILFLKTLNIKALRDAHKYQRNCVEDQHAKSTRPLALLNQLMIVFFEDHYDREAGFKNIAVNKYYLKLKKEFFV